MSLSKKRRILDDDDYTLASIYRMDKGKRAISGQVLSLGSAPPPSNASVSIQSKPSVFEV